MPSLPTRLGGVLALGVLEHFDTGQRQALLSGLANRLPIGAGALLDLQSPEHPARVEQHVFAAQQMGEIEYRGLAEAWPLGGERMRWRMTYLQLDGTHVLSEKSIQHVYHHPSPEQFRQEAERRGFVPERLMGGTFWLLRQGALVR